MVGPILAHTARTDETVAIEIGVINLNTVIKYNYFPSK